MVLWLYKKNPLFLEIHTELGKNEITWDLEFLRLGHQNKERRKNEWMNEQR